MLTTTCTILVLIIRFTLIIRNQHPPQHYRPTKCPTRFLLNLRPANTKPQASDKDNQPLLSSIYQAYQVIHGAFSFTSTTLLSTSPKMTAASSGHNLRGRGSSKKTSNAAADDLMKQVALEKKVREEKEKKRQADKKAKEELTKAQEREETALARTVMVATAISPPSDMEEEYVLLPKDSPLFEMTTEELTDYATGFLGLSEEDADNYVAQVQEQKESFEFMENEVLLSDDEEEADHLARHGVQANNLFGDDIQEVATPTIDLSENLPEKKKTKSIAGAQKKYNRYTTKGFTIPPTAHAHTYPLTYVEAAICLTSDDKPKEFIVAIKLILKNAKYLDPNFGLVPL